MLRKFEVPKKIGFLLLIFFSTLFVAFYILFPTAKLPYSSFNLIIIGLVIPILYLSFTAFHPILSVIILSLILHKDVVGIISTSNFFISLDFYIQWGLFIWGIEMGSKIKISKQILKLNLSRLFVLPGLFFLINIFLKNNDQSLFLAVIFISVSSLYTKDGLLGENILSYFLIIIYLTVFINPYIGLYTLIFVLVIFGIYFIYDTFLKTKIKLSILLFLLSFITMMVSYHINHLPIFVIGVIAGMLFFYKKSIPGNFLSMFYKYLIITLILSRLDFILHDFFVGFIILSFIFILNWISFKDLESGIKASITIEFPLSFYFTGYILTTGNIILTTVFLSLILISFLQYRKKLLFPALSK